jgi:SAM-dependent methyltransferase
MTDERPLALDAYEALADSFDERAPTKPFNADLERPSTRSLLPDLDGRTVLDAGCGPGITTRELLDGGARVVGVDVSPRMLRHARARTGGEAEFVRADLGRPLPFDAGAFDLVHGSLAFDYLEDWRSLFAELARVLRPVGTLVCSVQHPVAETLRLDPDDYFETERVTEMWTSFGDPVDVSFYRRPLGELLNPLLGSGFRLERVLEAKPTDRFREKDPETYERVSREPTFLCLQASLEANPQ